MKTPWSTINVRIPPHQISRFEELKHSFSFLQRSTLVRIIFGMVLDLPLEQQKRLVTTKLSNGNVPTHVPAPPKPDRTITPKPVSPVDRSLPMPNKTTRTLKPVPTLPSQLRDSTPPIVFNRNLRGLKIRGRKPKSKNKKH